MIILPNKDYINPQNEKISTYQFLANAGCPVFYSALFEENEELTREKLLILKKLLNSEYCTIRYQYVRPCTAPIRGGNKSKIDLEELRSKQVDGTQMWLLQPIDRTKNIFGINMCVNKNDGTLLIECVGKGFDVSDLNRGDVSPHESIFFNYPIEFGWQNEWWKFIKISFVNQERFIKDKIVRLNKLKKFGLSPREDIFDENFIPLNYSMIEKLLVYIQSIDDNWQGADEYTVSLSMNSNNKLVFWDIQTPSGKTKILMREK